MLAFHLSKLIGNLAQGFASARPGRRPRHAPPIASWMIALRSAVAYVSNSKNSTVDSRPDDAKACILLVDDEAKNLAALQAVLEPLDQNLLFAKSGEEALGLVLEYNPAVILLDVRMPGLDGFETARLIRSREQSRHTPIIFMTGVAAEMESAFRGYTVGAADYLLKPLVPEVLQSKVSVFVELHKKNAALNREIKERRAAVEQLRESQAQLRALAGRLISVREEERTRIAREVHDELGQALTGLKLEVQWLAKRLTGNQKPLLEKTQAMAAVIDSTVRLVRRISAGLRPEILDEMGLVAAIRWQAEEFQKRMGIRCRLKLPAASVAPDKELSTAVFRIFQELLTNVARHAKATSVTVDLDISEEHLRLCVADNGIGISEDKLHSRESLGLLGMRERVQLFAGKVDIRRVPAGGTAVSVSIPISHTEQ